MKIVMFSILFLAALLCALISWAGSIINHVQPPTDEEVREILDGEDY